MTRRNVPDLHGLSTKAEGATPQAHKTLKPYAPQRFSGRFDSEAAALAGWSGGPEASVVWSLGVVGASGRGDLGLVHPPGVLGTSPVEGVHGRGGGGAWSARRRPGSANRPIAGGCNVVASAGCSLVQILA
jgi:hypothetical protein